MARDILYYVLFNEGAGAISNDLANDLPSLISRPNWQAEGINFWQGNGMHFYSATQSVIPLAPIGLDAGCDFTFHVALRVDTFSGANPGLWRSGSSGTGTSFCIIQGSGFRPWIRWNNVDVLKPSSGPSLLTGNTAQAWTFVIKSAKFASFYINGELLYTATHSAAIGADAIFQLLWQSDKGQKVFGLYEQIVCMRKALTASEIASLYADPWQMIEPPAPWRLWSLPSGSSPIAVYNIFESRLFASSVFGAGDLLN